jgi:hypothetical protein
MNPHLKELIDMAEKEIVRGSIMKGYYQEQSDKEADKEERAKLDLKVMQLEEAIATNEKMLDYFKRCS